MSSPSLVIRNGTIVDGSGDDPYEADLAVSDGKIAAIGGNIAKGTEEVARYDAARITGGDEHTDIDCTLEVIRHLPMYLPDHGGPFVQSDAFGSVKWGSRAGWGSAQLSETDGKWQSRPEFIDQIAAL